jgi:UDP-N-acetylmuramyl pentapeptide phosphotransferase/UDP-N-acetylglucosamine-1-phosphate transferase
MIGLVLAVLSFGASLIIGSLLIPEIIKIAHAREFLDHPDHRKVHKNSIPTLGGVGIFAAFIISVLLSSFINISSEIQYLLGATFLIVLVGTRDDLLSLGATSKLIAQFFAACIAVYFAEIHFTSLHGLFGVYEVSPLIAYPASIFTIIVITNAFNLIDGIDGLAGTVGLIIFLFFGLWFALLSEKGIAIICFSMVGAIVAFLRYNYSPARIFMGDTGSLLLGFVAATIAIRFFETNASLPSTYALHFGNPISLVSALLVYPLFDTLRVFVLRILRGVHPLQADRNHLHHLLLNLGCSHSQVVSWIVSTTGAFVFIFIFSDRLGFTDVFLVPILVMIITVLSSLLHLAVEKKMKLSKEMAKIEQENKK